MLSDIVFDPFNHTYMIDGQILPSVTEITRFLAYDYKSLQPWAAEIAARRGTAVHEACMLIDYGEEPEENSEITGYLVAYRRFLSDYSPQWKGIEQPLGSLQSGYAGTVDRYGTINDIPCIVDLKTGQKHVPALTAQLNGYWWLLLKRKFEAEKLYGLYLRNDGTYELVECEINMRTFNACSVLHNATKKKSRRKKNEPGIDAVSV